MGSWLSISPLALRLRAPLYTSRATYLKRSGWVVRVQLADQAGSGEAMPLSEMGTEVPARTLDALTQVRHRPVPTRPESLDQVDALMASLELDETPAARHAVECALLELVARTHGVPVARLLSPEARPRVGVNALLSAIAAEDLAVEGLAAVNEGFRVLKVKVGGRAIEEDRKRLLALRRAVGDDVELRLDPNGGWGAAALGSLDALAEIRPALVEQPVEARDIAGLRALRGRVPCRIAADEAIATVQVGFDLLGGDRPAVDVLALRPMVLGGLLGPLRLARAASARGVGACVVSSLDGPLARAAGVHLAAALPDGSIASGLAIGRLFADDAPGDLLPLSGGGFQLSAAPGWA